MFHRLRTDRCRSGGAGRGKNAVRDSDVVRSRNMVLHLRERPTEADDSRLVCRPLADVVDLVFGARRIGLVATLVDRATTATRNGRRAANEGGTRPTGALPTLIDHPGSAGRHTCGESLT